MADDCLPESLGWLILTCNRIPSLPPSFSHLVGMRKLMLATNLLTSMPDLTGFNQLELARFSDNRLGAVHPSVFTLPMLSWLALAGNPALSLSHALPPCELPTIAMADLVLGKVLG